MRFADRTDAGEQLADRIALLPDLAADPRQLDRVIVLALPRGGVPVGGPVADRLGRRLGVLLVRKLGVPGQPELAMGAIAAIGAELRTVSNREVIRQCGVGRPEWQQIWDRERAELERRTARFADWIAPRPDGAAVVLVDDGLATGATMRAAVAAVRDAGAGRVVVGIPTGSPAAIEDLERDGVDVVALSRPDPLDAVGASYRDFHQLSDDEVLQGLRASRQDRSARPDRTTPET